MSSLALVSADAVGLRKVLPGKGFRGVGVLAGPSEHALVMPHPLEDPLEDSTSPNCLPQVATPNSDLRQHAHLVVNSVSVLRTTENHGHQEQCIDRAGSLLASGAP